MCCFTLVPCGDCQVIYNVLPAIAAEAGADLAWIQDDDGDLLWQLATGGQLEIICALVSRGWHLPSTTLGIKELIDLTAPTHIKDSGCIDLSTVSECILDVCSQPISSVLNGVLPLNCVDTALVALDTW